MMATCNGRNMLQLETQCNKRCVMGAVVGGLHFSVAQWRRIK